MNSFVLRRIQPRGGSISSSDVIRRQLSALSWYGSRPTMASTTRTAATSSLQFLEGGNNHVKRTPSCFFSTDAGSSSSSPSPSSSRYVVVDHGEAYQASMKGAHGMQLALAQLEGLGKDDPPFDPFQDEDETFADDDDYSESGDEDDDDEDEEEDEFDDMMEQEFMYNPDGSVRRAKSTLAALRAGAPAGGMFAIIPLAGSQHKVTKDDLMVVNRLKPVEKFKIGSVHTLNEVMLVGSTHLTLVGLPFVPGAEVDVMVEEITRDAKVIVFKKRRRKHSQRKNGFRRDVTMLRVLDVRMPEEYKNHNHVSRDVVDELEDTLLAQTTTTTVLEKTNQAPPSDMKL